MAQSQSLPPAGAAAALALLLGLRARPPRGHAPLPAVEPAAAAAPTRSCASHLRGLHLLRQFRIVQVSAVVIPTIEVVKRRVVAVQARSSSRQQLSLGIHRPRTRASAGAGSDPASHAANVSLAVAAHAGLLQLSTQRLLAKHTTTSGG
jgi:hypothetical protein